MVRQRTHRLLVELVLKMQGLRTSVYDGARLKKLKYAAWRLKRATQEKVAEKTLDRRVTSSLLLDIDYQLAVAGLRQPRYFTRFANRTQSRAFRDVISLAVSQQRLRFTDLAYLFRLLHSGKPITKPQERVLAQMDKDLLADFASLLVNRAETAMDMVDANAIFSYLRVHDHWGTNPSEAKLFALEAYAQSRRPATDQLQQVLGELLPSSDAEQAAFLRANQMVSDYALDQELPSSVTEEWSEIVSQVFRDEGMRGVVLSAGTPRSEILDSLVTDAAVEGEVEPSDAGPLVTVIMPTYRPDRNIFTAVRAVLTQTHKNLELIIVDDGSGPEYAGIFQELRALDPRVVVVEAAENAGAYAARNLGVKRARGDYITVQDDDDWAHAQKLEWLVAYLEDNPSLLAAVGSHVRFSEDGEFIRIGNRPQFSVPCYAAILFRKRAFEEVGLWQEVRKAGDSELMERIQAAQGVNIPVIGKAPTTLTRVGVGRLTSGELNRGYIAPARRWYVSAYRRHRGATGGDPLRAANVPQGVPAASLDRPGTQYLVDYLVCADYTHDCAATGEALKRAAELVVGGFAVGLVHLESPIPLEASQGLPQVFDFLETNPDIPMLSYRENASCSTAEVFGSSCVEYADSAQSRLSTEQAVVFVGGEGLIDGELPRPNLPRCVSNLKRLVGVAPTVQVRNARVKEYLEALGYGPLLDEGDGRGDGE